MKIVPLIQEENEGFVHHMVMYECFGNFTEKDFDEGVSCTSRANMPYQKCRRYAMVAAWACLFGEDFSVKQVLVWNCEFIAKKHSRS